MWMMLLATKTRTADRTMGSQSAPRETVVTVHSFVGENRRNPGGYGRTAVAAPQWAGTHLHAISVFGALAQRVPPLARLSPGPASLGPWHGADGGTRATGCATARSCGSRDDPRHGRNHARDLDRTARPAAGAHAGPGAGRHGLDDRRDRRQLQLGAQRGRISVCDFLVPRVGNPCR